MEAKEKYNHFDISQIERHLEALKNESIENKILLTLAPFENDQNVFLSLKQKHKEIIFLEQSSTAKQEESHVKKSNKEQLQELKEMLDDGLITQEDFEQKKKQILGL